MTVREWKLQGRREEKVKTLKIIYVTLFYTVSISYPYHLLLLLIMKNG